MVRFRTYRIGELPDIMISTRDLLAPLAALVHHDPLVAKLIFAQLYSAVRQHKLRLSDGAEEALHEGVVTLLGSERGGPAFVACLHELAISEDSLHWMPPEVVSESAKRSGNLHTGVRILEKHLLSAGADGGPPASKRARGGGASAAAMETDGVKVLLAELYGLLGEEDIVRGLVAQITQSEHTRLALAAEAAGDSEEALRLFEQVLGDENTLGSWEQELARRGRRDSLVLLGKWEQLRTETDGLMAAEEEKALALGSPLDRCGVNLAAPWVRMWALSRCKLPADGAGFGTWPADAAAPDIAPRPSRDRPKLLANGYGPMLLLDRLASGDANGARALLPPTSNAFIERWATLHPLASAARMRELRPLQLMVEVAEVVRVLEGKQARCGPTYLLARLPPDRAPAPSPPGVPGRDGRPVAAQPGAEGPLHQLGEAHAIRVAPRRRRVGRSALRPSADDPRAARGASAEPSGPRGGSGAGCAATRLRPGAR